MDKRKCDKIIDEINNTLKLPNEQFNGNQQMHSFRYTKNIKSTNDVEKLSKNPTITLIGKEKVFRYNSLFNELYKNMDVCKKRISLKCFQDQTQQLMFSNEFDLDHITNFLNMVKYTKFYNLSIVWGVIINQDILKLGKYTFIKKDYLIEYLKNNTELQDDECFKYCEQYIVNTKNNNMTYVLYEYESFDSDFAREMFKEENTLIVNVIRYMLGMNRDNIYVSESEVVDNIERDLLFTNNKLLLSTKMNIKEPIPLDPNYYYSKDNANYQIWNLINNLNSDLNKRIINSIQWVGRSLEENVGNDISIIELAFAFETLLKKQESVTPITASIQGSISEMVSFIVGKDLEERLSIKERFKKFYSKRSAVVHGGSTEMDKNLYYEFLYLFKDLIIQILTNEKYKGCKNIKQLYDIIDKYKFRV